MKFSELDLPKNILKALQKMGFEELTPIQEATYSIIKEGKDLCALAETGSGKTAACAIPIVEMIKPESNVIQSLVIVPTRELCLQYVDEIEKIAKGTPVSPFAVYGGFSKEIQVAKLNHGVHVLVATPGRLIDLIYDGSLSLDDIRCVILDEADELLKEGFFDDIEFIMSCMRQEHQTLLFSATMADDIKKLAHDCQKDPVHISLIKKQSSPKTLKHCFKYVHPRNKENEVLDFIRAEKIKQAIIFCNARHIVDKLSRDLSKEFKGVEYIHAGLVQGKRSSIFRKFKRGDIKFMIATDVAGRGLDFSRVSHVINWDFPAGIESYTHRTGRAGRMGREGKAFTVITKHDIPNLKKLINVKKINPVWIGKDPLDPKNMPKQSKSSGNNKKRSFKPRNKNFGNKKPPRSS